MADFPRLYNAEPSYARMIFGDIGFDSIVGGYYEFYKNGNLKEYSFFIDTSIVVYREQFDSTGKLMYKYGEPSLYRNAYVDGDSVILKVYLFTLNKKYTKALLRINNKLYGSANMISDTLFSNTEIAYFAFKKPNQEEKLEGKISFEYQNYCTGEYSAFSDSVLLKFTPPSGLVNLYSKLK